MISVIVFIAGAKIGIKGGEISGEGD